jgi:hypothetical protein
MACCCSRGRLLQLTIQKTPKKSPTDSTLDKLDARGVTVAPLAGIIFVVDAFRRTAPPVLKSEGESPAATAWNKLPQYCLTVKCNEHVNDCEPTEH